MVTLKFKDIKKYISMIDRVSICIWGTQIHEHYEWVSKVPEKYDDLYLYGIGIVPRECREPNRLEKEDLLEKEGIIFRPPMEIMLSQEP